MSSKPQLVEAAFPPAAIDQESPQTDQDGNLKAPRVLNSWKDIANYLGRGVRTVQRYESQFGLPVRRPAGKGRSSVVAFAGEVDAWLGGAPKKRNGEARRMFFVLNSPGSEESRRKALLEVAIVDVQADCGVEEILLAAKREDVEALVIECAAGDNASAEICRRMKQRHPGKQVFALSPVQAEGQPARADLATDKLLRSLSGALARRQAA